MPQQILEAKLLTVSDSVAAGNREDVTGFALTEHLTTGSYHVVEHRVVPDVLDEIANALSSMAYGFNGVILTTGGAGFAQRDFTPEATRRIVDRLAPGMGEAMRAVSARGRLSRVMAGTRGASLILNLSASPERAIEMLDAVIDALPEALELLGGDSIPTDDAVELTSVD